MTLSSLHQEKLKYLEDLGEYYVRQKLYQLNNAKPHHLRYRRRSFHSKESFYEHLWTISRLVYNIEYRGEKINNQARDKGLSREIENYFDNLILKHTCINMDTSKSYLIADKWEKKPLKIINKQEYEEIIQSRGLNDNNHVWEVKSNNLDRLNMNLFLKKNLKEEFSFNLVIRHSDIFILPYFLMRFSIQNYTHLFRDAYKTITLVRIFLDRYLSSSAYMLFSISGVPSKFNPYGGKDTDTLLSDDVSLEEFEEAWSELGFVITSLQISNIFSYLINLIYLCRGNDYCKMVRNYYIHPKILKYKLKSDVEVLNKKKATKRLR